MCKFLDFFFFFLKSENCYFKVERLDRDCATSTHFPFPVLLVCSQGVARQLSLLLSAGLMKDADASTDRLLLPSFGFRLRIWILALLLACSIGGQGFSHGTTIYRSLINSARATFTVAFSSISVLPSVSFKYRLEMGGGVVEMQLRPVRTTERRLLEPGERCGSVGWGAEAPAAARAWKQ